MRVESGAEKTFHRGNETDRDVTKYTDWYVWTGTDSNGARESSAHLGSVSGGLEASAFGQPFDNESVWSLAVGTSSSDFSQPHAIDGNEVLLGLYGLSDILYLEPPDAPYATVAAITSTPANSGVYRAGETITATVTFSEAVAVDTTSGTPSLGLGIGSNTRDADYQSIDSTGMVLTFAYPVVGGDEDLDGIAVAMGALKLNGGAITGTTGDHNGVAAVLTHAAITADENQKVDGDLDAIAPSVDSATVSTDGTTIDIVFDEDLDRSGSEPAASAFVVTVDGGTAVDPMSVDFHTSDADTITLTMATADTIDAGATATVAYDQPTTNPLKDAADNEVADFTQTVLNRPAAPVVTLTTGNEKLTATWSAPANGGSDITGYAVEYKEASAADSAYTAVTRSDADALTETISSLSNDTEYTVRVRAANASGDGPWAEKSATPMAADTTAPSGSSATVSADGMTIDVVFDEDLDRSGSAPAASAFEVTVDGGTPVTPDSVDFHASDADTFTLTMAAGDAIAAGATVTVGYDKPEDNPLKDAAGNEVGTFTGQAAPNRPAAPVVTLSAGDGKLTAMWAAPADGGSTITHYDVEWKTASQTWAQAATAGQSDTATSPHEITGLTNGIEHAVRVRAGNDAGDGPWSAEASETPVASITQVTAEFGAASYTATEGGTAATVTVNLSADPERSVTIPIIASGANGATADDYTLSANSVTIPSGSTSATFTVTATDDSADDDDESVSLAFGTLPDRVSPGTQSTATVNLTDNDHPQVTAEFGAASYTATEGGTAATVTVNLSADPERSVTIPIIASGANGATAGDYTLSANSVTIPSGSTSATFTVTRH